MPLVPGGAATRRLLWEVGLVEGRQDELLNRLIRACRLLAILFMADFVLLLVDLVYSRVS